MKFALATTWALCAACSRAQSDPHEQPAPATSVITLGIEVGGCPDIAVCERECEAGSADRCRRMAVSYALGEGAEKNETRATALYEHGCEMDDPVACVFAGQMNEFAHGVVKDDARATRFYERGCNLRSAPACYNLAIMYDRGTGVPRDRARAGGLYQLACAGGAQSSCDKAVEMRTLPVPFLEAGPP
jgi:TPR repeat protein